MPTNEETTKLLSIRDIVSRSVASSSTAMESYTIPDSEFEMSKNEWQNKDRTILVKRIDINFDNKDC